MAKTYANVGRRAHYVPNDAPSYYPKGFPVAALCGTIFIPTEYHPEETIPTCGGCELLYVQKLRFLGEQNEQNIDNIMDNMEAWVNG